MVAIKLHSSVLKVRRHKEKKIQDGFKRINRWILDITNQDINEKMRKEALALKQTQDMEDWDNFALEQLSNIDGWV